MTAAALVLLFAMLPPQASSAAYPWVYPGDFRDRLRMSDLVVSGTIQRTQAVGTRVVDGWKLTAHDARVQVDRVFQGEAVPGEELAFTWFLPDIPAGGGFIYSGPPIANLQPGKRYLIFLKHTDSGCWRVAMPLFALEVELNPSPPAGATRDLRQAPTKDRYRAIAEELEAMALAQPVPAPGTTGEAAMVFSAVYDLIGGCAEPLYRHFLKSRSLELRRAAMNWLDLIRTRKLSCQ
ncbi:MAG: hypothetical protein ACRD3E_03825 [Terriglobales bacterium]